MVNVRLEFFGEVLMALVSINELLIQSYFLGKRYRLVSKKYLTVVPPHGRKMHLGCPCVGNNIMRVHDVSTFKATQFAPLLNSLRKEFLVTFGSTQNQVAYAVHEDFANDVIKATHSLRSHTFILEVHNELISDLG